MTNEVTRADDSPWAVATYAPSLAGAAPHAREETAGQDLSFATLLPPTNGGRPQSKCHHTQPQA